MNGTWGPWRLGGSSASSDWGYPSGNVKRRRLKGRVYYYLQERRGHRVVHRYLGREKPAELIRAIDERRLLRRELAKVRDALRLITKVRS